MREASRQLGMALSTLQHHVKAGHVTLIDGKVDVEVAGIQVSRKVDPDQSRRALAQYRRDPLDIQVASGVIDEDWRARREKAEAQLAELELREREGELVRRDDVAKGARRAGSAIVQAVEPIPDRLAAEFGTDDDHRRRLRARCREFLNQVLAEVARAGMVSGDA